MPSSQPAPARGGTFPGYVLIDPPALARILDSPSGPIGRRIIADGELVKIEARRLVGVHVPHPADAPRARRPGTLRDSIVKRVAQDSKGFVVLVGSEDPIALLHHEGTVPHTIRARTAPFLVFYSRRLGRTVRTRSVNHPGTKPNRYLTNATRVLRGR